MRVTLLRLVWIVGAIAAVFFAFSILDGTGKLRYGVSDILNAARFYTGYLWNVRRGAWRKKLELGAEDYRRLEYYCEGPKLECNCTYSAQLLANCDYSLYCQIPEMFACFSTAQSE
ncbi:hypothetical protein RvY_09818-2 [Ramazzottius varieornatus]|uniref:Uncharacterized protein n=1 Tax=Ramazzottius varieornatus TaxID=947166 RepID=A0A1D1VAP1_RAMVA|nr:hypothetical protein RvY_09818-2 [Ramazzottius varieornatus]